MVQETKAKIVYSKYIYKEHEHSMLLILTTHYKQLQG